MKILFFDVSGKGGIAHHIFMMCHALAEKGAEIRLVTTRDNELDLSQAKFGCRAVLNPHHHKRGMINKGITYLFSLVRFLRCVIEENPDIVHIHEPKIPFLEYLLIAYLHQKHIKVVCSVHDILPQEKGEVTRSLKKLYPSFDCLIVHTEDSHRTLKRLFHLPQQKIRVIPVGEYSSMSEKAQNKHAAREALNILPDRRVLLFFGYIRKYKGLLDLLEALSIVRKAVPKVFLIIAGQPKEDFKIYKEAIAKWGIEDMVFSDIQYIPLKAVSTYFSAADLVVLPYTNIYQSGIVYLAFAYKKPVIVTNVGGLPEVVEEGKSGYIVPPGRPEKLAQAIACAFSGIPKLERMGRYAFRNAKEKYAWKHIAESTLRAYRDIMTHKA